MGFNLENKFQKKIKDNLNKNAKIKFSVYEKFSRKKKIYFM